MFSPDHGDAPHHSAPTHIGFNSIALSLALDDGFGMLWHGASH
jgi:hypothetical protein